MSLAGCGGAGGGSLGDADEANATDAAFVRAMITHERSVGSLAQLGREKALRAELRGIATERLGRHGRSLRALGMFDQALRDRRVSPRGAHLHQGPPPFDARRLRRSVSLDHEFLVLMIQQHEYAMAAASVERDRGGDRRLKALAQDVYDSSRRDVERLRHWLRTWYGDDTQRGVPPGPPPGGGGGGGAPAPGPEV